MARAWAVPVPAAPHALAVPVRALLVLAHRPGSEALVLAQPLVLELLALPAVPRAVSRSAVVVELPSRQSSSAAMARIFASRATGAR